MHTRIRQVGSIRALVRVGGVVSLVALFGLMLLTHEGFRRYRAAVLVYADELSEIQTVNQIARNVLALERAASLPEGAEKKARNEELQAMVTRGLEGLSKLVETGEERSLIIKAQAGFAHYLAQRRAFMAVRPEHRNALVEPTVEPVLVTIRQLESAERLVAEQAQSRLAHIEQALMMGTLCFALLVLAALTGFVWLLERKILQPLRHVERAVIAFRDGNTEARIEATLPIELAHTSAAVNSFLDHLSHQRRTELTAAASVAHELRNPLSALKLGIASLQSDPQPLSETHLREVLAVLERQLAQLTRMTDDLLDAYRVESGTVQFEPRLFDLRNSLIETSRLYQTASPKHHVEALTPAHPVMVNADPGRVEQILSNLTSNAIKYSPAGGSVVLRLVQQHGEAVVEVADQGIGIAHHDKENLFEPFRRGETRGAFPGAGLGLAVVKRLAEAQGVTIEIHSVPGLGSTFRVHFPLAAT